MIDLNKNFRSRFAIELFKQMKKNKDIYVLSGDLGYKMWDLIRYKFPQRFLNVGAAEQTLIGVAVGLALEGKIPIAYSITPFLLYRPFETIRNYLDHEKIPVKLVSSGRDREYGDDGFSHWAQEDKQIMRVFKNIKSVWPRSVEEIPGLVEKMINDSNPWYLNLKR